MVEAIATLSIVTTEFAILGVAGWLITKLLGVDEIVDEIERAHRRGNVHELRKRA